jgi:hypothetical protein
MRSPHRLIVLALLVAVPHALQGQGVTTSAMSGLVSATDGPSPASGMIVAEHVPSGTLYRAVIRAGGAYSIPNMRIGGPYRVTATSIGFAPKVEENVFLSLGQAFRLDFRLVRQAVRLEELAVLAGRDEVLNAGRNGAATFVDPLKVTLLPSIKRSTRDLTRLDPRSDGNFSFAGRNWLYNNVSLDGSYFNNPYGLDDPAPGGQTNAEPVPFDAVEQVQVSIAPFDIREGGFTGANINTVTKSGTNSFRASLYSFYRNDNLEGNSVRKQKIVANPTLKYLQSGFSFSGPLKRDKLFFYVNAELERTDDPGSNFVASTGGSSGLGISRVQASVMDAIKARLIDQYDYDPGTYQGYIHETDNNKVIAKLNWNINESNDFTFRYNHLDAKRDLGPHPFVLSFNNTGRGPNASSLPFSNSGYAINNKLHSFAAELNSRSTKFANRFFASYNRFRDFRTPFSVDFPTIEIGEAGVTYTTAGHEPFSIHNVLDQDVYQLTNNFTVFKGKHTLTFGANFENFKFFNSFNLFRHGLFQLPYTLGFLGGATFPSVDEFFAATAPGPNQVDFNSYVADASTPFKGEKVSVGQLSFYAQDEFFTSPRLNLTIGARVDMPMYFTDPVDNAYVRGLIALDENRQPEVVDQSKLPGTKFLFSPRIGFNWNASGDRKTQVRGGTGIFTGRVPFVWIGNIISNPGANPALYPTGPQIPTGENTTLAQSFYINAMDPNFKWPQSWTTDLAIDQQLGSMLGTLEVIYGKDFNSVFMRNANLRAPVRTLPDGRPYFGGAGNNELNNLGGSEILVIDNKNQGHSLNVTAQLRKEFGSALNTTLAYSFTSAKNNLKSTEIASVLWENQPVQGDPNNPELSWSEFGQRHRIVGSATWSRAWSEKTRTSIGMFLEIAQGNRFSGAGGNRYSFIYAGDVNGDGQGGNDLIYIPASESEINLDPMGAVTPAQQWAALNAFIEQDNYLKAHRGQIAERFGAINPWYSNIDFRIMQDLRIGGGSRSHNIQLSVDMLNFANLFNSSWGVRKVANPAATSPLTLVRFNGVGAPVFNFTGPSATFIDDPSLLSRWRMQVGLRYFIQ